MMIRENVMLVIVKAMKSPRSALCKTSIMACTDVFHSYGNILLSISEESAFDQLVFSLTLCKNFCIVSNHFTLNFEDEECGLSKKCLIQHDLDTTKVKGSQAILIPKFQLSLIS